jgi:hypothetical protein
MLCEHKKEVLLFVLWFGGNLGPLCFVCCCCGNGLGKKKKTTPKPKFDPRNNTTNHSSSFLFCFLFVFMTTEGSAFSGCCIVVCGFLSKSNFEFSKLVRKNGGSFASMVTNQVRLSLSLSSLSFSHEMVLSFFVIFASSPDDAFDYK